MANSRTGKAEFPRRDANSTMPLFHCWPFASARARELTAQIPGRAKDRCGQAAHRIILARKFRHAQLCHTTGNAADHVARSKTVSCIQVAL